MTELTTYLWQKPYDAAVLEMDLEQLPVRVQNAFNAIEERLRTRIEDGGVEHRALMEARRSLGILKKIRG
jgi:hypothetical protein